MGILSQTLFSSVTKIMNVKIILCLALVFICLKQAAAQGRRGGGGGRRGGEGPGRGKRKPCDTRDNIESCICEDGETYEGHDEVKDNCGRGTENKPVSCQCNDGSTWTPPEKPCGGKDNIVECTCEDGETYEGFDIKRRCRPRRNPIVSCACEDGTTWTP